MTKSDKFAYGGSLLALLAVFLVVVAIGFVGDMISNDRGNFAKAEGFIADMDAVATRVPRLADGSIARQGPLSTAWMDDAGALPERLQAMAGSLRGAEDQRSLGMIRKGPWPFAFQVEAKDSLVWTYLVGAPKAVCDQFIRATIKHPEQVAYVSSSGDPPVIPTALDPVWTCRTNFLNLAVVMLDPPTELRRLAADIQNAIKTMPAELTDKLPISGSSAPFQVTKEQEGGPGFLQRGPSGIRVTLNNVPLAMCRLALLSGPKIFGMDAFELPGGERVSSLQIGSAPAALCTRMKGHLVMHRS
jgi:hypothetical protein